jgi:hypothetical protein
MPGKFISLRELSADGLEAALLIKKGMIEAYAGNLTKSKDFLKAVDNKVKIETKLRKVKTK